MKKRILSAIVMIIIFIPILLIGGKAFVVLTSLLAAMGLYELLKLRSNENKVPLFMRLCSYLILIIICTRNIALFLIGSVLFLGFSFNLLIIARNYDLYRIIYLLLLSTMTDTFALITGKLVGKHKLVPKISPNKTIEGLLGGVIMGTFIASSFYHVFINPTISLVMVILITTALSIVGQIGDLVFSMIKRYYNKKDFSNLIPGHGGILDRFDSIIFIALAFILVADIL